MKTTAALRSVAAGSLFLAAALAFSQDDNGFYLSAATMATFAGPHDFAIGPKPADNAEFTPNRKGAGSFGVGILGFRAAFGFGIFGFRPEAELSYQQVGLSTYRYTSFSRDGVELSATDLAALNDSIFVKSGHLILLGAMANLWFDIPTGTPISPYLGGGVGLGRVTLASHSRAKFAGATLVREFPRVQRRRFRVSGRRRRGLRGRRRAIPQPRLPSRRHLRGSARLERNGLLNRRTPEGQRSVPQHRTRRRLPVLTATGVGGRMPRPTRRAAGAPARDRAPGRSRHASARRGGARRQRQRRQTRRSPSCCRSPSNRSTSRPKTARRRQWRLGGGHGGATAWPCAAAVIESGQAERGRPTGGAA